MREVASELKKGFTGGYKVDDMEVGLTGISGWISTPGDVEIAIGCQLSSDLEASKLSVEFDFDNSPLGIKGPEKKRVYSFSDPISKIGQEVASDLMSLMEKNPKIKELSKK